MPFPFGKSQKNPAEIVKSLKENVAVLEKLEPTETKKCEKGKKDVVQIFSNILRRQIGTRTPTVEYISSHTQILFMLLKGYESPEVALNCGMMLRECLRHEPLARTILFSEQLYNFFRYVELSTFDIASDAFASFKVFTEYEKLLHSENYVTKRQSLKRVAGCRFERDSSLHGVSGDALDSEWLAAGSRGTAACTVCRGTLEGSRATKKQQIQNGSLKHCF
ncbi:Calcium-binding protein 39 [Acipenser ruthenus]|uniref:Calcium-binding protein 39 n=1 Tax=Acipenser ruthenus TaxID=7906 RepID=A0A444URA5_ACIRT|nr:Calcium-binding protein 39 [Acipenser ruthenus]